MKLLFPYSKVRRYQKDFIKRVYSSLKEGKNAIVHAPTGLGKTISSLAPILTNYLDSDYKIFFLTPKITQHDIVVKTIAQIEKKFNLRIPTVDLVGKQWMCPYIVQNEINTNDFYTLCSNLRKQKKCGFYSNTKENFKLTENALNAVDDLKIVNRNSKQLLDYCTLNNFCAYEMSLELAKKAKVIVGDYYYIFHPSIRQQFLEKIGVDLDKVVLVVDEAHNLPTRIRNVLSSGFSNLKLISITKELESLGYKTLSSTFRSFEGLFDEYVSKLKSEQVKYKNSQKIDEMQFDRKELMNKFASKISDYGFELEEFLMECQDTEEEILTKRNSSQLTGFIYFYDLLLHLFNQTEDKYVFYFTESESRSTIRYNFNISCLDPSVISGKVFSKIHRSILMSGTLTPLKMYEDILSVPNAEKYEFLSPFPKDNRIDLIIPETSTKYNRRNPKEFQQIGKIVTDISERVDGNVAVFFPSYDMMGKISNYIDSYKFVLRESRDMNKSEKEAILNKFKELKKRGCLLLAVANGNFSEGVDLPGDYLNGVIVVGLPLQKPTLELKKLIEYYDLKFKKGWDYAYINPAFSKIIQSAGRCIRSGKDKGVIAYIDERFMFSKYMNKLPRECNIKVSKDYLIEIDKFNGK